MESTISELKNELGSLPGVKDVEAYPTDHDFSTLDVVAVTEGVEEEIRETIEDALADDESLLEGDDGSYILYEPLGVIEEHDGSTFDIVGYTDSKIEVVLVERASDETASVGSVWTFDRGDTDYDVTLHAEA